MFEHGNYPARTRTWLLGCFPDVQHVFAILQMTNYGRSMERTMSVDSVNGLTGAVNLTAAQIPDAASQAALAAFDGAGLVGFERAAAGAVARTSLEKMGDIVSPMDFGAVGDGSKDDTQAIQEFFDYIRDNYVIGAELRGKFSVCQDLTYAGSATSTPDILCAATFFPTHTTEDALITISGINNLNLVGAISIVCPGGTDWTKRTIGSGVSFIDCSGASVGDIDVIYAKYGGVRVSGTTAMANFKRIRAWYCGTARAGSIGLTLAFKFSSNTGTLNNANQNSIIDICEGVPDLVPNESKIAIDGTLYQIEGVNGNQLAIFPQLPSTTLSGTANFYIGYGLLVSGGNTSCLYIGTLDTQGTAIGLANFALYPANVGTHITQSCGIAHLIADSKVQAAVGGFCGHTYFEQNDFDIVQGTSSQSIGYHFGATTALTIAKCENAGRYRVSSPVDGLSAFPFSGTVGGLTFAREPANTSLNVDPENPNRSCQYIGASVTTIQIASRPDPAGFLGDKTLDIVLQGAGPAKQPGAQVTILPPTGQTINGGLSVVYQNLVGAARVVSRLRNNSSDWQTSIAVGEHVMGSSVAFDPPSLAAGAASAINTCCLAGVSLGDFVEASFSANLAGVCLHAWVSSADHISYQMFNPSGNSLVDLPNGTVRFRVRKA
jgi:hypothetical protein